MRDRTVRGLAALLLLAVAAQAAPPDAPVPGPKAGKITALLPTANIVRGPAKQEVTAVAKKGDDVVWNDLIRTDKGGRARITLLDQSILSVGSQAQLRVIKSDAKSQQTSIEVGYGRVRMEVTPITQQGGSFEVKTPTAVAGVIGTTFGVDSGIGSTTFLCVSGTTMVGSSDPAISGRVPCTAGMAAVVAAGKPATTRPATQQELQQLVQDTEPAVISSMTPSSLSPGATADASITGTQLGSINAVSSSVPSVTATLNPGGTATSIGVHLVVAANASPGPVTLTFSRPSGVNSAAVFTISPGQAGAGAGGNAPSIQGLSTTTGPASGGVSVTITGANFDPTTKVMFGSVASSSVTFVSSTQLTVVTPPGNPGPVDLTVVTGSGMTATLSGGFSFGGPVAAINPPEITVNPGAAVTLDGSRSSDTLAGTTLSYSWTFCALGFKPPQTGASLLAATAPVCSPATGTVPGSDSQYALTPPVAPGQYFARLQVTDNLGASAVVYSSVTVNQANYLDPLTCTTLLAQAYSTLQLGSPGSGCGNGGGSTVLGFFDPTFSGLTALEQSLQNVFPTYSSMQIHLVGAQLNSSGGVATVTADWELLYTIKNDPACKNASTCQPYHASLGTVTTVWTLAPGTGWSVTNFRYPNGFPQGPLPNVPLVSTSPPSKLVFTNPAQKFVVGTCSPPLTVQSQDGSGNQVAVSVTETLAPASTGVSFYLDGMCSTPVSPYNLTIPAGSSSATLYMIAAVAGSPTIMVMGSGAFTATATQTETVTTPSPVPPSALAFASPAQTLTVGACSGPLTLQTQDSSGNPASVGSTEALTPSGPAGALFYLDKTCTTAVTPSSLLIATGTYSTNLYMTDTATGSPTITVTGSGAFTGMATQTETVTAVPVASKLAFTSPAQTLTVGACSAVLTVQSQDSSGTAASVGNTEVLTPSGPTGASFYIDGGCATPVTASNLTISTGANTASLYMKATVAGAPTITVTGSGAFTATGANAATQTENVTVIPVASKLAFTSPPQTPTAGTCSAALTVQSQDSSGTPANVNSTEFLAPSGPTGTSFYIDSGCATPVTASNLTIASGTNSASFYLKNTAAGSPTITVIGTGAFTATVTQTGVPSASILVASSAGNTSASNPVELNGPLTDLLTLTATRSDNTTTGSVTLGLAGTTVTPSPAQLTSIPYATAEPVDFNAAIDGSGNVTTGSGSVTVTPSNATPPAGTPATTLYFKIGDITLSLPSGTTCIQIGSGLAPVPAFSINAVSGFNISTVNWQWSGLTGVTVNQVSGTATLSSGTTYALPAFTFTVVNPETATFLFAVTVTNAQGSATKAFSLTFDLSATPCGSAGRLGIGGVGGGVSGTWSRGGFHGGMAKAVTPAKTGPLPDLQINAASVSFSPSVPKPGDTVSVRFRVTNAGKADAQHVPIALLVNGATVASDTFDVRAGASTLAGLEWANAHSLSSSSLQAAVVVDPNHTVVEQSTLAKSAPLVHFTLLPASGGQTGGQSGDAQRATLEVADGGCVGFSFASGADSACGSADVEISAEQLTSGHFTMSARIGIADLGSAFGGGKLAVVQYEQEAPAIAGHSYAVQLRGGKTGILRLMAIRNPGQTAAASGQVFGGSKVAGKVGAGQSSGPVETGDVSGVRTPSKSKAYFDVSYQTQ